MCINSADANKRSRQSGVSLVEVIIFIVIVSVGVAGLMGVMSSITKYSADPMLRKQAIAVAESLLEEIALQPFTVCDPDAYDPGTGVCATAEGMGPETIAGVPETRYSIATPFDNVSDYHNFNMNIGGIKSLLGGATITGLEKFAAVVTIAQAGGDFNLPAANVGDVLRINVQVTDPKNEVVTLTGYRFRYAPIP